jgi:hypothetical protein
MWTWTVIHGLSFGLEYFDRDDIGFGINIDAGILRLTWYKDIVIDDE